MIARTEVEIREQDFVAGDEYDALLAAQPGCGACVVFTGLVRGEGPGGSLEAMELEHYPGMTEASIAAIVAEARSRWALGAVRVIHRVGRLAVGAQIVFVGVSAAHRGDAFAGAEFVMDYLKTRAPIWKKEIGAGTASWVQSRGSDAQAAARWDRSDDNDSDSDREMT